SKLLIRLCRDLDIPYLVLERGHFSRTISVDALAQFAHGGINLRPHSALDRASGQRIHEATESIKWVRSCEEVPYAHKNQAPLCFDQVQEARANGKPILLFIGVNDLGSGTAYVNETKERHSPQFTSTNTAFSAFMRALEHVAPEALVLFKPHP